jgi:hypothetical protein
MRWFGLIYPRPTTDEPVKWLAGEIQKDLGKLGLIHAEIWPEQGQTRLFIAFPDNVDPTTGSLKVRDLQLVDRHEFTEAQGLVFEAKLFGDSCKYDGHYRRLCEFPCGFCWKRSFASSERAASADDGWDPRRNSAVRARNYASSAKRVSIRF